jgi:hypothetical protein
MLGNIERTTLKGIEVEFDYEGLPAFWPNNCVPKQSTTVILEIIE